MSSTDGSRGLPSWLVPTASSFRDLIALSLYNMRHDRAAEYCTGLMAAAGWINGQYSAPVTSDRTGTGPDPDIQNPAAVEAECWAAGLAGAPEGGLDMSEVCRVLDVPLRLPLRVPRVFAAGVHAGLRWMLGMERKPPMPLPWRGPDGRPAGADYIYETLLEVTGPLDEYKRGLLRESAQEMAQESWALAKQAGQLRSQLAAGD